ncbi:MAG TPA: hypothetical protein VF065_04210, partial [Ilumatobacter sp.]
LWLQVGAESVSDGLISGVSYPEDMRNGGSNQVRHSDRREIDEPHAVRERIDEGGRDVEGEPGLADPTRSGQGDDAARGRELGEPSPLGVAADETR